jgi:hypothetical protein
VTGAVSRGVAPPPHLPFFILPFLAFLGHEQSWRCLSRWQGRAVPGCHIAGVSGRLQLLSSTLLSGFAGRTLTRCHHTSSPSLRPDNYFAFLQSTDIPGEGLPGPFGYCRLGQHD